MLQSQLTHVGIIMDGNRRWAKQNLLDFYSGYEKGADNLANIIQQALVHNIKFLSCYVFSSENWSRSTLEISSLTKLLSHYLDTSLNDFLEKNVKFIARGDYHKFGNDVVKKIHNFEKNTAHCSDLCVNMLINYGSKYEIIKAVNDIVADVVSQKLQNNITEEIFNDYLCTKDMPDLDLVIRTGGEKRLSNFLLWQASYAELYFSDILWPSFSSKDFDVAVNDFYKRERKKGK